MATTTNLTNYGRDLRNELIDAIEQDPTRLVSTPGFKPSRQSAADVVQDALAGSDTLMADILRVVGAALKSPDAGLRYGACALVARIASEHAAFHQDDAALDDDDALDAQRRETSRSIADFNRAVL